MTVLIVIMVVYYAKRKQLYSAHRNIHVHKSDKK